MAELSSKRIDKACKLPVLIIWLEFVADITHANFNALFSGNAPDAPYDKQVISLERSVFTGKSQTSARPYRIHLAIAWSRQGPGLRFSRKRPHSQ